MMSYFSRRLMLMVPTLFGILLINFIIIQAAPGGPVVQMIAKLRGGSSMETTSRIGGGGADGSDSAFQSSMSMESSGMESKYRGSRGLDPEFISKLEKMYGFDQPAYVRFFNMIGRYLRFDFGDSYFRNISVSQLILEKLPVSISMGLWSTLLIYGISIPLGIRKAVRHGSSFDVWTSWAIILGYAIPSFLFALFLIIFLAGGSFIQIFPLRGLVSENWHSFGWGHRIVDYFWHIALPLTAMVISGFASLTLLTKNSFLEEINKQYVLTARAKGVSDRGVLYGHIFRNAMLVVVSGFPVAFVHIFFTSSLLIEVIFSLDGLGLLGFEAALSRDYPVVFGTLFIFTLVGLVAQLLGDLTYMMIDPRIDFEKRRI